MKLQVKLAFYNALTKLAIILFTGALILFTLERISYNHTVNRLHAEKNELLNHLSKQEISEILTQQQNIIDYNILREEYIKIKPIAYKPSIQYYDNNDENTLSTEPRTIGRRKETYLILTSTFNFDSHSYQLEIGETINAIEEFKSTIKGFTMAMLFIAVSLSLLIDLTFTRYLLRPFYLIIEKKLIKVNDPMNFDYEKVKTTTQDFKLLDDSISTLMQKITNLFILEKQFIANVSHELLTPISIISSRLENVLQQELSEESENKIFASLKTLNRLKSIINSLLLISQIENNQFNKGDRIKINEMVKEVYDELQDRMGDKEVTLINKTRSSYTMQANRSLIYTLLFNIINNAIKYNHQKGSITIADTMRDDSYTLKITDTGMGMDEKEIEKAFNRFEKLDTDEKESYGLGLAIVKSIAVFHNISVQIQSAKNEGTTFKLIFNR